MADIEKGFAFKDDVDGSVTLTLGPGTYIIRALTPEETDEHALVRARTTNPPRLTIGQLKNIIALPTGRPLMGLTATALSATAIRLTWERFPLAFSYEVQRSSDGISYGPWQILSNPTLDATNLTQSTQYFYQVRGRNALGGAITLWTKISATTLIGLEAVQGTSSTTVIPALTGLGYNATVGLDVLNLLFNYSEPIEGQISRNGELVTGTILGGNAGKFNAVGDTWLGYSGRLRLDRSIVGQGGIQAGDVITVKIRTVANRLINFVYTWTVQDVANTAAIALPLSGTDSGTVRLQVFAQGSWSRTVMEVPPTPSTYVAAQHRHLGLSMYMPNTDPTTGGMVQRDRRAMIRAAELGFNFARLTISYEQVESYVPGAYDFRKVDEAANLAHSRGQWIVWAFDMSRSNNFNAKPDGSKYYPDDQQAVDIQNRRYNDADSNLPSYSSMAMREQMLAFVDACVDHIKAQPYFQRSLLWSITTNPSKELGYSFNNLVNGTPYLTSYDYSQVAQAGFRAWVQAQTKWNTIAKVNTAWNTNFSNYSQVVLATPNDNGNGFFQSSNAWQVASYVYKEQMIADFAIAFRTRVRAKVPNAASMFEDGSLFDLRAATNRVTVTMASRLYGIEAIKQNGAANYPLSKIRLSTAISMRDWGPTRMACDELGFDHSTSVTAQRQYMLNFFQSGGHLITVANFFHPDFTDDEAIDRLNGLAGTDLATILAVPVDNTKKDSTYTADMLKLIRNGWQDSSPQMFVQFEDVPGDYTEIIWDATSLNNL